MIRRPPPVWGGRGSRSGARPGYSKRGPSLPTSDETMSPRILPGDKVLTRCQPDSASLAMSGATMNKDALEKALARELDQWSKKGFAQLCSQPKTGVTYVSEVEEGVYQTEVTVLESTDEYCHVGVSVDDMTLWRSIKPLSTSFICYQDGRIEW